MALLAGLHLATALQVQMLKVHSDSQLVVNQITRTFSTKSPILVKYLATGIVEEGEASVYQYTIPSPSVVECEDVT